MKKYYNLILIFILSGVPIYVLGQTESKHFVFSKCQEAQILYKNKRVNQACLNYNKATEEMVYASSEGINMALYPIDQIDTIYIGEKKFIPVGQTFNEVLLFGKYTLYASYRCRLSIGSQNTGYGSSSTTSIDNISSLNSGGEMYQLKLPENYKVEPYTIFKIDVNGQLEQFRKVKDLTKIFPKQKKRISEFIKTNKIKSDNEGIAQTVEYISTQEF